MPEKGKYKSRLGEKFITNEGYTGTIIEYLGVSNVTIRLNDWKNTVLKTEYGNIVSGSIKNPNHIGFYGMGYLGEGKYYRSADRFYKKGKQVWRSMLTRCYDPIYQSKQPTYIDANVCEEWRNFQVFMSWFEKSYNPEYMEKWHLDKDIICKECKIYSPETCAFVPQEINYLVTKRERCRGKLPIGVSLTKNKRKFRATFTRNKKQEYLGDFDTPEEAFYAYKTAKEKYIKEVAEEWRDKIDTIVYDALINYEVNITD